MALRRFPYYPPKFTKEDDIELKKLVKRYGIHNWSFISKKLQQFPPRMCKERYMQLKEANRKAKWTREEEEMVVHYINEFGTRWSILTKFFPKRTANDLKNRYYRYILPRKSQPTEEIPFTVEEPAPKQEEKTSEEEENKVEPQKEEGKLIFSIDDLFSNWFENSSIFDTFEFESCC